MALLADRVKETTTTTGTGTVSLAGAPAGFQSFNTAFANGSLVYYVIQGGAEWEIGIGTTGTGTLARTQVLQSSNADALVPFSAGVKDVFCSYVADRAVTTVDAATLTNKTIDDYTNNVGANSTHFRIKATGTLSKGTVVKATGYNPGENAIEVAVVTSATDLVLGISEQALTAGQFGLAVVIGELMDVNTNGLTVGGIIYSNGSGGFTQTKPSSGTYQPLGWVVRANASTGVLAVNVVAPLYVETATNTANTSVLRDGSGNFAAGTITATLSGTATQVSNALTAGTYLTSGGTYNGSAARTFAVDATDANTASKVVARDASGNFSAGTITATLNGAAPAGSLSGSTLASGVTASSLTSVGTLSSLTVSGNTIVGAEVFRSSDTSFMRLAGGNPAATGANLIVFGSTHATAPGRVAMTAVGTGAVQVSTGGALRAEIDASGNLAVDTNTLFVDAANNRVGVGTASPAESLSVFGGNLYALRSGGAKLRLLDQNNEVSVESSPVGAASDLIIKTASTTRLTVDASGNLGLGVTPSAWGLGKALEINNTGNAIWGVQAADLRLFANTRYDGTTYRYTNTGSSAARYDVNNGTLGGFAWYTAPSGTAGNAITFTQAMTLDASGNLAVGTTSAVAYSGNSGSTNITLSGSANPTTAYPSYTLRNSDGSTAAYWFLNQNTGAVIGTSTNHYLGFITNNTERARITSGGYVKASDAGTYGNATGTYHELRSSAGSIVAAQIASTAAASPRGLDISFTAASPDDNTNYFLVCADSTTNRCFIYSDGDLANHDGVYGTISDAALKQDIVDATSQWDDLKAVRFRKYRMKTDVAADANAPYQLGVIAQELAQTSPGLVDEHPNEDGTTTKTVKSSILLLKAAVALQEAMARIETLEQRVLALEA